MAKLLKKNKRASAAEALTDEELTGRSHQPKNLVEFLRESPFVGAELDLERQKDERCEVEFEWRQ